MRPNFLDTLAIGKQNAINRRNRGHGTRPHPSWMAKRSDYATADHNTFGSLVTRTHLAWDIAADCAVEDYLRVAFPERYEGFE